MANKFDQFAFDEKYYKTSLGNLPYDRHIQNKRWIHYFSEVADHVVEDDKVNKLLDVGCAKGFLVECLRDRGKEAYGFDISKYAISRVREDIKAYCTLGSVDDPDQYNGFYDMIICIEVLEHVTDEMARKAIELMCQHTNLILFSSSPNDFEEKAHINVNTSEYWDGCFARHGFMRTLDDWPQQTIASHAVIYRKGDFHPIPKHFCKIGYENERVNKVYSLETHDKNIRTMKIQLTQELIKLITKKEEISNKLKYIPVEKKTVDQLINETSTKNELKELKKRVQEKEEVLLRELEEVHKLLQLVNKKYISCFQSNDSATTQWEKRSNRWLTKTNAVDSIVKKNYQQEIHQFKKQPLISIITPVHKVDQEVLKKMIASVLNQFYQNWEMCISFSDNENIENLNYIKELSSKDSRIKLCELKSNKGISANTNQCLKMSKGDYIAFLDHDDSLTEDALFEVVKVINHHPLADFIYSDRDQIEECSNFRTKPLFKPSWSLATMLSVNYVVHFTVLSKKVLDQIGELALDCDGAQDWEFFLRASEVSRQIIHIPKVLYHWRMVQGSTACSIDAKPYALESQLKVLNQYLSKKRLNGCIVRRSNGLLQLMWELKSTRRYQVIIYFEGNSNLSNLEKTLISVENQYCKADNIIVIMPENINTNGKDHLNSSDINIVREDAIFTLKDLEMSKDSPIFLLEAGVTFSDRNVTNYLVAWLEEWGYYGISGKIVNKHQLIENAGYVMNDNKELIKPFYKMDLNGVSTYGSVNWYREYMAVSESCLMVNQIFWRILSNHNNLNSYNILQSQIEVCKKYHVKMGYDPFLLFHRNESKNTVTLKSTFSLSDGNYNPSVWDWNIDDLYQ